MTEQEIREVFAPVVDCDDIEYEQGKFIEINAFCDIFPMGLFN